MNLLPVLRQRQCSAMGTLWAPQVGGRVRSRDQGCLPSGRINKESVSRSLGVRDPHNGRASE